MRRLCVFNIHTYTQTYVCAECMHAYIHTNMQTNSHAYTRKHIYIHASILFCAWLRRSQCHAARVVQLSQMCTVRAYTRLWGALFALVLTHASCRYFNICYSDVICIHIQTCINIYMIVCIYVCINVYIPVYIYICIYLYIYIYIHIYTYIYIYIHIYT